MTTVLPAIIPFTKEQFTEEIRKVSQFASVVQVDICDGVFSPNRTWPYNGRDADFFEQLKHEEVGWPRWEDVEIELHLMVSSPEEIINDWVTTGISSVVAHIEATTNFQKFIDVCRAASLSVGIALKPGTDIERIAPFVSQVDFIQVMGNELLGKHGVELDPRATAKIKTLREKYPERIIAIDIGVTDKTAPELVDAGANKLISGGDILNSENPEETFRYLQSL